MSKRSRACAITPKVREAVEKRDHGCCIFCHSVGRGEAHIIPRSQGGLGVPENIVTVCRSCHIEMDNGLHTKEYKAVAIAYIRRFYPDWSREKVTYTKWRQI